MISHKMSLITIFGHKHEIKNFIFFIKKFQHPAILVLIWTKIAIKKVNEFWTKWQVWPKNVITQIFQSLYNFIFTLVIKAGNQNEPNIVDLNVNVNFGLISTQKSYPLTWKIQLKFKDYLRIINGVDFDFNLNFSLNKTLDQASLSTTFKSSESDIKLKLNLVNKEHIKNQKYQDIKKVTFDLQCNGKILFFETNILRSNPGEITFEMKNNLIPVAKFHGLFRLDFTKTNVEAVIKYTRDFETKPLEELMKMKAENNNNEITLKANVSGKPLCGTPCDWNMEFDGTFSGENVKISVIEPFSNAGKINFEGSWTYNGHFPLKINIKGQG